MSVRQILKAKEIIAVVPDARKAQAVNSVSEGKSVRWRRLRSCGPIRPQLSISTKESASLLSPATLAAACRHRIIHESLLHQPFDETAAAGILMAVAGQFGSAQPRPIPPYAGGSANLFAST